MDTKSYREQIALRALQAGNDENSYGVRLSAAATLQSLGEMLCDEVDRVRAERDALAARLAALTDAARWYLDAERNVAAARVDVDAYDAAQAMQEHSDAGTALRAALNA